MRGEFQYGSTTRGQHLLTTQQSIIGLSGDFPIPKTWHLPRRITLQSTVDGNVESCFKAARSAFVRLAGKEYSLLARGNAGVAGLQERGSP